MRLLDLPDSCLCHALSHLEDEDLQVTKQVSRYFLSLSNSMRRVIDLRDTKKDVFCRNYVTGKTGSITIGLRRFPRSPPARYIPISGFPNRYVSSVYMSGISDDIYKCDVGYLSRLEIQPLYYKSLKFPDLQDILSHCTLLRTLIIPRVEMTPKAVAALSGLTRLSRLNISDAKFEPGTSISFPESLTDLDTSFCRFASHNIAKLTKLRKLDATDMELDNKGLAGVMTLTNLETLDISWNDPSTGSNHDFSALKKLRNLTASMMGNLDWYYRISGIGALRCLVFLELENCCLWSYDLEWFGEGTNIRNLNLSYNYIDSTGVAHICRASQFEKLDLSYNRIDDEGARTISAQTDLKHLDLQHNHVTSEGAKELATMDLVSLILSRNFISQKEVDDLLFSSSIRSLSVGRQRSS